MNDVVVRVLVGCALVGCGTAHVVSMDGGSAAPDGESPGADAAVVPDPPADGGTSVSDGGGLPPPPPTRDVALLFVGDIV